LNKRFSYSDGFLAFAFTVAVYMCAQIFLSLIIATVPSGSFWYWFALALSSLILGVVSFVYAKLRKINFLSAATVNSAPKIAHAAWGILAVIGLINFMIPVNTWICDLLEKIGLNRPSVDLPMQLVPLLIVGCLIPAITEEFTFRGVIGNALSHGTLPYWKGVLISGALFSLFHMNPAQTLHQFVLGCFLTLLAYRSGSVWTAAIVHLFNNVTAVLLSYFVEESGFYTRNAIWLCLAGGAVFALSIWGYFATVKTDKKGVYFEAEDLASEEDTSKDEKRGKLKPNYMAMFGAAVLVCAAMWFYTLFN